MKPPPPPPTTVSDFLILPLALPNQPGLPASCSRAKHYLYIKPHTPNIPTPYSDRSLFVANIPFDALESSIRALFAEQLGGAMVERVEFDAAALGTTRRKSGAVKGAAATDELDKSGKKRKRSRAEDEERLAEGVLEDEESALPRVWAREVRRSGANAVVVFVDEKSAEGALKSVKRAIKSGSGAEWRGSGGMGVDRYKSHLQALYPPPSTLQSSINSYLTSFSALETLRSRTLRTARSIPDAEGFVTVSRGSRTGPARLETAQKKAVELAERREKNGPKDDFYRFQNRERRKEEEGRLRRRFEEDRDRVRRMREGRGS